MTPTLHDYVTTQLGEEGAPVALEMLEAYAALIRQWTKKINLVAPSTVVDMEQRHILDCAQLLGHLPAKATQVLDCGSGAGLPGLVLAILAPQHTFTLAERDQRKAAFLFTAKHALKLENVVVWDGDVRDLPTGKFGVVTARAWADTAEIVQLTQALLVPTGEWLLLKGEAVSRELEGVRGLHVEVVPSIIRDSSWIVRMRAQTIL